MNNTLYSRQRNVHVNIFINVCVYWNGCLFQYMFVCLFMHVRLFSIQHVKICGLISKKKIIENIQE